MSALEINIDHRRGEFHLRVECAIDHPVVGIVGPSGAGKSTLLHCLAGLYRLEQGRIALQDTILFDSQNGIDLPTRKRRIGVVFQDSRLFPHKNVQQNLTYSRRTSSDSAAFNDVVDLLDLSTLLTRKPRNLSGGEQRRVALGRALLSQPRLLLLDEPLTGLDRPRQKQILPYLLRIRDELDLPIVYVSHDIPSVLQMTNHVLLLDRGEQRGFGTMQELATHSDLFDSLHDLGFVNVLRCKRDTTSNVVTLENDASIKITAPVQEATNQANAEHVAFSLRPEDIALATNRVDGVSIRNQIHGFVRAIHCHAQNRVLIEVDIRQTLFVLISERARRELHLEPGDAVWCLIKTTALCAC